MPSHGEHECPGVARMRWSRVFVASGPGGAWSRYHTVSAYRQIELEHMAWDGWATQDGCGKGFRSGSADKPGGPRGSPRSGLPEKWAREGPAKVDLNRATLRSVCGGTVSRSRSTPCSAIKRGMALSPLRPGCRPTSRASCVSEGEAGLAYARIGGRSSFTSSSCEQERCAFAVL